VVAVSFRGRNPVTIVRSLSSVALSEEKGLILPKKVFWPKSSIAPTVKLRLKFVCHRGFGSDLSSIEQILKKAAPLAKIVDYRNNFANSGDREFAVQ